MHEQTNSQLWEFSEETSSTSGKMHKVGLFLSVLVLVWAAPQNMQTDDNLEALIAELFGQLNQTTTTLSTIDNKNQRPTTVPPIKTNSQVVTDTLTKCKTEYGEDGECVSYYLCDANNTIITDGVGLIDNRGRDNLCPSYLDECCVLRQTRDPTNPITPPPEKLPQHVGCGWRNPNGVGLKFAGAQDGEAQFGEFPWMVAILKIELVNENDSNGQKINLFVGGGSLIHPSIVLTAAHYATINNKLRVRAGEWDTQTTKELYPYQERDVLSKEVHKEFNKNNLFYDIALLFLATPMEMAPNVGLACLPPPRQSVSGGTQCFASGWGKDRFGKEGIYQVILKKVELPVVERTQCQSQLRKTRLGRYFQLHSTFMCAGGVSGKDTCKGDGGSPLVCPMENEIDRYMQSGIVAWGIGCGENRVPGVYVDVSHLRDWVDDKVIAKGYEPKVYSF